MKITHSKTGRALLAYPPSVVVLFPARTFFAESVATPSLSFFEQLRRPFFQLLPGPPLPPGNAQAAISSSTSTNCRIFGGHGASPHTRPNSSRKHSRCNALRFSAWDARRAVSSQGA